MLKRSVPHTLPKPTPGFADSQRVVLQPQAASALWSGAETLVNTIKPTLGPLARAAVVERNAGRHLAPDLLHDSGVIARRLVELPDPNEDIGAQLLRHALWRQHELAGDAVATAAVLFHAIVLSARPYLATGGNAMLLHEGILRAGEAASDAINKQAEALPEDEPSLQRWLLAHYNDAPLSSIVAAVLAATPADTTIRVENGQSTGVTHEFIAGAVWKTGWHGSPFAPGEHVGDRMLRLPDARVLVSDLDLSDPAHMEPLIMALTQLRPARMLVVCRKTSPQLHSLFVQARQKGIGDVVFVQPPPVSGADRIALLTDMAILTGATFIPHIEVRDGMAAMVNLASLLPACLGHAKVAWASEHFAGIGGGRGEQAAQVAHLAKLNAALEAENNLERIAFTEERMTTFGSGLTRLKVGAHTDAEQKQRKAQAERVVRLTTQARRYGVVPGAGVALLRAESAACNAGKGLGHADARFGATCVSRALSAPMRVIAHNAGLEGGVVVHENRAAKRGWGFDVQAGQVVNLRQAGLLDSAYALSLAVQTAASAAATLLTTDVIVHRKQSMPALRP